MTVKRAEVEARQRWKTFENLKRVTCQPRKSRVGIPRRCGDATHVIEVVHRSTGSKVDNKLGRLVLLGLLQE